MGFFFFFINACDDMIIDLPRCVFWLTLFLRRIDVVHASCLKKSISKKSPLDTLQLLCYKERTIKLLELVPNP